jgi:hypothetical protein
LKALRQHVSDPHSRVRPLAPPRVAAIGAAAVTAGVALIQSHQATAADYGSTIFDASKKTGLHAEALSAMDFAAKQSGTSLEAITGGVAKFAKTVGEAADGSDKAAAKLKDFGIHSAASDQRSRRSSRQRYSSASSTRRPASSG